jgi:methylglutaconyl-CoA hydratase
MSYATITVTRDARQVAPVTLNRPDVRNAFNAAMGADLRQAFGEFAADTALRAVVLQGAGKVFCAGADIEWMRASGGKSEAENLADAQAMQAMYRAIDTCPVPVIGRVHKGAFGGGVGLAAVCDIPIALAGTLFSLSEAKLGIIPAVISPFMIRRIGGANARRLFVTAEVFDAAEAYRIGLVSEVAADEAALDAAVARAVDLILGNGPAAVRAAKALVPAALDLSFDEAQAASAREIARIRGTEEAQSGLKAFLDKTPPPWKA